MVFSGNRRIGMITSDSSLLIDSTSLCDDVDSASVPSTSTRANILSSLSRFRNRLGTEMDEIIPNLYLGSLRDAVDIVQLKKNRIQSIVSVHDLLAQHPAHEHLKVLRIQLSDCSSVDISAHFSTTNEFIHSARLKQTAVLVHCLAGVSRSATVVAAYLITVCDLSFSNALKFISKKRPVVNPNFGFRMQLCAFAERRLRQWQSLLPVAVPFLSLSFMVKQFLEGFIGGIHYIAERQNRVDEIVDAVDFSIVACSEERFVSDVMIKCSIEDSDASVRAL
ncbi:unnamed protein product [Angiostrongylus costaricensis]|uniref:Dual specificity protein phosphatase n=1 Tax=Angiostrongylus costaricensis TaxID=334426 RepID=A0A0R3PMQ6_ANGCS|nr:unnamed protein product [Angiostrongylus costaricensis]